MIINGDGQVILSGGKDWTGNPIPQAVAPKSEAKADNAPELKEEKKKDEKEVAKASEKEDTGRRRDKDTKMVYSDNEYSPEEKRAALGKYAAFGVRILPSVTDTEMTSS